MIKTESITLELKNPKGYLYKLGKYLDENFHGCLIMPTREGGKIPLMPHKNDVYTYETFKEKGIQECDKGALILLTEDLIVVDVDDRGVCAQLEEMIPEFQNTVICETSKGKHYYFRSTDEWMQANIKDGARQMKYADGSEIPIDIKTRTSSGTKGVISIPPSIGKKWTRPLGEYTPSTMPNTFINYFKEYAKPKKTQSTNRHELQQCFKKETVDQNEIKSLVKILDGNRANNYDEWMQVGWCLHNINKDDLLGTWIEFSKGSTKYKEGECERLWNSMVWRKDGMKTGTLHMWAKTDNPFEYKRVMHQRVFLDIQRCGGTHNEVAAIAYKLLHGKYVCALSDGKLWYYFDGSLWKPDKSELRLRHELSTTIKEQFNLTINKLASKLTVDDMQSEASTSKTMKEHKDVCDKLTKIASKLQDSNFKNHTLSEMREYFYDEKFMENLDNNSDLIAFTNGVWDLKHGVFRSSTPDDYVSLSVGYDYYPKVNEGIREKIEKYWQMMHPDEEQRKYVIKMFARQLYGDNGCNLFHVHAGHQGSAGNGKTKFFDILERCLGDYVRKFGVEFLTAKDRPEVGKAMPEYQYWKGIRLLYCTEPNHNDVLNTGIMKDLTGGEKILYRLLFSNEVQEFRPKFKIHIMCNDAPQVDGTDSGVKRRIRKIDYLAQFVDDSEVDEANGLFKKEEGLVEEYETKPEMKMEFLRLLLDNYNHNYGFAPPKVILDNSLMYLQENDKVYNFIKEFIRKDNDGYFTLKEAKELFKHSEHNNGKICTLKNDLQKALKTVCCDQKKINGRKERNVFVGYVLVKDVFVEFDDLLDN